MLTEDDIQKLSGIKNYIKADRYRSGRRIQDVTVKTEGSNIIVSALVKGVDSHAPKLVLSMDLASIVSFTCSCAAGGKEFCSHCAALALHYRDTVNSPSSAEPANKFGELSVYASDISLFQEEKTYNVVILSFDRSSRELVFLPSDIKGFGNKSFITLKVLSSADVPVEINDEILLSCSTITANLLDFIKENGFFSDSTYYIGQSKIDMLFTLCTACSLVYYRDKSSPIEFSSQPYKPSLSISNNNRITMKKDFVLINGKHTNYIFKDAVLARLPRLLSTDLLTRFEKGTVVEDSSKLESYFEVRAKTEKFEVFEEDLDLTVNIYLKYEEGFIVILPEILYASIASIRPVPFFASTGAYFGENPYHIIETESQRISFLRNMKFEYGVYSHLNKWSFDVNIEEGYFVLPPEKGIDLLFNDIIPGFLPEWKIFYDKEIEKLKPVKKEVKISFDLEADNGFLEFDVKLHIDSLKVSEAELLEAFENNRLFKHGDIYIEITNEAGLKRLFSFLNNLEKGSGPYKGELYHITELYDLMESEHFEYTADNISAKLLRAVSDPAGAVPAVIPEKFDSILRNYQIEGINWMNFLFDYGFGGILADDMGLGKTLQTLVMLSLYTRNKSSLIVCPKTLMFNWQKEIEKFTPGLEVILIQGGKYLRRRNIANAGAGSILITSYPLLQRDIQLLVNKEYDFVILDEAQYIKNPDTLNAKSIKLLKAAKKLALTGTPMENSILDLWSVFDFIMPGFLGSENDFKINYQREISSGNNEKLSQFKKKIKPFLLRRTKIEVLSELPPKIEQVQYSALTKDQLAFYVDMLDKIRQDILMVIDSKGFNNSRIEILAGLTRLRQICNHPGLVDPLFRNKKNVSGKTDLFEELINECTQAGHKVIVFSQFTKMLDILGQILVDNNLDYSRLDGSTNNREKVVEEFTFNENKKVFLISLKAGGYGLNLTCADTVIIYDPWWNPMVESQASDRTHRIGQNKVVNVYSLITKNTIEEKIQLLKQRKRNLFNSIITESGDLSKQLTQEDILEIISPD